MHVLTATATDAAAVVSSASTAYAVTTVTAVPPATARLTLAPGRDSGVPGDDLTNVTTPAITGTGTPGDTVTRVDGDTAIGTALLGAGGARSITTTALAAGPHSLTATQTDPAGNLSPAARTLALTIVTVVPPATAGLTLAPGRDSGVPGDDLTNVTTPAITGTGTPGDTVTRVDGDTAIGTALLGAGGARSITTTALAAGPHSLTATQTDPAGNLSPAASRSV